MKWRQGDLGRFQAESPKRPRFEVIGVTNGEVEVWYGGATKTTCIPEKTFRRDCINLWELQEVVPARPTWLKEGASFEFPHGRGVSVRQAEIKDPKSKLLTHTTIIDLNGQSVTIRSIRRDYTSCLFKDMLVLVPLPTIAKFGIQRMTRWERVMSDRDAFDEDEEDDDLFKDF